MKEIKIILFLPILIVSTTLTTQEVFSLLLSYGEKDGDNFVNVDAIVI